MLEINAIARAKLNKRLIYTLLNVFQIEMDFHTLFNVQDNLYLKWTPSFANRVIKYASQQANWLEYLHVDATTIDVNSGTVLIFYKIIDADGRLDEH